MNELLKEDVDYILSRLPKGVFETMKKFNLYLAGGFIRAVISGETPSDIDLLGVSKEKMKEAADYLQNYKWSDSAKSIETSNAITVIDNGRLPVQFITRWCYNDPTSLINEFDFTIAQSVIWHYAIDLKWKSICSDLFYQDIAAKRLRYTSSERKEDAGGSILRVVKFLRRGYNIAPEELSKVICQLLKGVKDGVELKDEFLYKILTGLMREVDPLRIVDGCEINIDKDGIDIKAE